MICETETVELSDCECVEEREKAIRVRRHTGSKFDSFWVPKSLILEGSEVHGFDDHGTIVLPEWLAAKEGIEP